MKKIPLLPFLLGVLSPVPLVIMAFIMMFYSPQTTLPILLPAFVGYAAIILSFIGGINWILSMQKPVILLDSDMNVIDKKRLSIAVVPCLFGELAIILTANHKWSMALLFLIIGFAVTLFLERNSYLPTEQPAGYQTMRWLTTFVIQLCLIGAVIFRTPW
ncbi:DUF3429 domain-containing protein [Commensalibacter nepenthis]|uniref:DUF3429 domain-containing protein n=1 Tax=Commensalibacter nepenthis TaxID=3043872 RepID=A0ABT6Q4R3_9PROT|nr:DUF3429 domain-containing protein [Commensalibacter sp. TBRC 10068]MDI2111867.1 DUF3429 domain-containing protein [Commensalibacter sp. TBRC 10068]